MSRFATARFRRLGFALAGFTLAMLAWSLTGAAARAADEDEDNGRALPGLIAQYYVPGQTAPAFTRYDASPAFLLAAGEAPDPRLPAKGWRVEWKGVLQVLHPGKHRFYGSASGRLKVTLDGQPILTSDGGAAESKPIDLAFGHHPLEISFAPQDGATELKLFWQAEAFPREPLPTFAVGHERNAPAVQDPFPLGRLQIEEHSCTVCHAPSDQAPLSKELLKRPGPKLSDAGARLKAGYIYHWLASPQTLRPEAVMPALFADDDQGRAERYAIAHYLAARGKLPEEDHNRKAEEIERDAKQGEALFTKTGCVVCHERQGDRPARATLKRLDQKTTPQVIAHYIENPQEHDNGGRMPGFSFRDGNDFNKLAQYVLRHFATKESPLTLPSEPSADALRAAFDALESNAAAQQKFAAANKDEQYHLLARASMQAKRCTNCHEMNVQHEENLWKPSFAKADFAAICAKPSGGCLEPDVKKNRPGVPSFGPSLRRELATLFLKQAAHIPGTPAPGEFARLMVERLNCIGCHTRNGKDGLTSELLEKFMAGLDKANVNAEAVSPPTLTGVTEKLQSAYIDGVLLNRRRSRPWMSLQMPNFHPDYVRPLSKGLAALDGDKPSEAAPPDFSGAVAEAGRTLVGEKGFGCIKCHDMLGIPSGGTRGPELSEVTDRVNYQWYLRWMTDPQRIQPGTRMPTIFLNGQSPHKDILDGSPAQQRDALWVYLRVAKRLPRPEGLHPPEKLQAPETAGPLVQRTFLPNTSARGIAIRYPSGVHLAFDAQICRLSYAWSGDFLDMNPAWGDRGGNRANLEGAVFWNAPDGFPWEITSAAEPAPDFKGRENNTVYGAQSDKTTPQPASRVHFKGYQTSGPNPVLMETYDLPGGGTATLHETLSTYRTTTATGFERAAKITSPAAGYVWLEVAADNEPGNWRTADGKSGKLSEGDHSAPATAGVVFSQQNRSYAILAKSAPANTVWQAVKQDNRWVLLLRAPIAANAEAALAVELWSPLDDKPAAAEKLLTGLLGK